ncbi:hypothetical protein A3C26_03995 [Candidatus Daviesbacteria bacterium RIFCSPHIGHO2_02_FULL_39_12]|uniref:Uncharacterized protein n=1 Tax=Candidatus Daviesbacteria bacterium RIFCSPHIGHO2_02_FULL_39_12 TaxID=1797770 RepID=A0A1F5J9F3_9BACT|nr:MAG: hypothetical protein A3C26_03995 [Candidatus Daviesbacteria bacterium RIFCSPHIGHO2_02_FULL_39_12]
MNNKKSSFPKLFNIQKTLGSLEIRVMKIIWREQRCTVRNVLEDLKKEKSVAYTTIMTVMNNLYKKRFVKRVKIKKAYQYQPVASENLFIYFSISKAFQNLLSEYGKLTVLTSLVPVQIDFPVFYKTPLIIGFLTSLTLGIFTVFFLDLLQNIVFFGSFDYINLFFAEPKIIFDHTTVLFKAFIESLPILSLLTNLILIIFAILIVRKMTRLPDFRLRMFS